MALDLCNTPTYIRVPNIFKIPQDRFNEANEILLEHAKSQLTGIDPDYYLFEFSNQELRINFTGRI